MGLTEGWLLAELNHRGVTLPAEVVMASLDSQGRLYVDLRQDGIQRPVSSGDLPH